MQQTSGGGNGGAGGNDKNAGIGSANVAGVPQGGVVGNSGYGGNAFGVSKQNEYTYNQF